MTPALTHVFTIEAQIAPPRNAGPAPHGQRLHIPITGGTVTGPRLQGRVLPGGSDWALIGPDGNSRIEAHYTIEASDGTLIYVVNKGMRVSSPEALVRVRAGEALSADQFYMRAAPVFDAPDGVHGWLRDRLFVSVLSPQADAVTVDVYVIG